MLLDWGGGKIYYTITLQITNCWEHFTLSVFAISEAVLTFYSTGYHCVHHLPSQIPAKTQELKLWYFSHAFWIGCWKLDLRAQKKKTHKLSLRLWQIPLKGGLVGHWDGMHTKRPQTTCLFRLVAAALFTPSGFFWSATINMNCNNYKITV